MLLWSFFFILTFVLAIEAYYQYPLMDGDAVDFLPHAISYARRATLIDPFARSFDATGQGRLVYHGFLPQIVTGTLCRPPTYFALRFVLASLEAVCLLALLIFLLRLPWKPSLGGNPDNHRFWQTALIIACLAAFATYTSGYGRPEMFATTLLLVGLLCLQRQPERRRVLCLGVTAGLVTTADPLPGVLIFFCFAIFLCAKYSSWQAIERIIKTGLVAVGVFFSTFLIYPYSISDWFSGMIFRSRQELDRGDTGKFFYYWLFKPGETFLGFVCCLGFCAFVFLIVRNWKAIKFRPGLVFFVLVLAAVLWKTTFRTPVRNYSLLVLTPILFAVILQTVNVVLLTVKDKFAQAVAAVFVLTVASGFLGFLRSVATFPGFLQAGLSYRKAQRDLASLRRQYPGSLGMTSGLFTLTEDYNGIIAYDRHTPPTTESLIFQQTNTGLSQPPMILGYRLVQNTFSHQQPRLLHIKFANTPQGYNYAFYVRIQK